MTVPWRGYPERFARQPESARGSLAAAMRGGTIGGTAGGSTGLGSLGRCGGALALVIALAAAPGFAAACECGADFELRSLGATTLQIAVAWEPVAGAASYVVERDTSCDFPSPAQLPVSAAVNAYGDTGKPTADKQRFRVPSSLELGTLYHYRVRAVLAGGELLSSCVSAELVVGPTRGDSGDLWADLVLGQPDFGQNDFRGTTPASSQWAGGVTIDRLRTPQRLYLADTNHNRILGMQLRGHCRAGTENLALERPYSKSAEPSPAHPDSGGAELTDGVVPGHFGSDSGSFGYPHGSSALTVDVDLDLGAPVTFNAVRLYSGAGVDRYTAAAVELFTSDDAQSFSPIGTFDNPSRDPSLELSFAVTTARYLRLRVAALTGCLDCDWLFLGEAAVRLDQAPGAACADDSECTPGWTCVMDDATLVPDVVLGQADGFGRGACNDDGTGQHHPHRVSPTAASLCLIPPLEISIAETVSAANMAVDADGALWVPDLFNHRVLRYDDPYAGDAVADAVWGQPDFHASSCNRGGGPAADRLCLGGAGRAGVDLDADGNLWIADAMNARVLRFPRLGNAIAAQADVALGQSALDTNVRHEQARTLAQMAFPLDVACDPATGRIFVADAGAGVAYSRVLEFEPPFTTGMAASRALPIALHCDFAYPGQQPVSLALDSQIHGLWVENNCFFSELFDLDSPGLDAVARVNVAQTAGTDVDRAGNLYDPGKWSDLYRFERAALSSDPASSVAAAETVFPGGRGTPSADAFYFVSGVASADGQIAVADTHRLLLWNGHSIDTLANGEPADDLWGEVDFSAETFQHYLSYPQAFGGQLWVQRRAAGGLDVIAFDTPVTQDSVPAATVPLTLTGSFSGYPVLGCPGHSYCTCNGEGCGSGRVWADPADGLDYALGDGGDSMWIADRWNNRVFRIANRLGQRDPQQGAFVDVILGQARLGDGGCNQAGGPYAPSADTMCYPYDLSLDAAGNLYVADNGGEASSNNRVLVFDAGLFTFEPGDGRARVGLDASRVLGTGGDFQSRGQDSTSDPLISPFKPVFHPRGHMLIGNNPYAAERHAVIWVDPAAESLPQFVLGDFLSYPAGSSYFDTEGNLYLSDGNWSRVLVYKQPLRALDFSQELPTPSGPPRTPTLTRTPGPASPTPMSAMPTATPTAACSAPGLLAKPRLRVRRNFAPAGDESLFVAGAVELAVGSPAFDPSTSGLVVRATRPGGTVVFSAVIPPLPAAANGPGWKQNPAGTRWVFRDESGTLAGGITAARVRRSPASSDRYLVRVRARRGAFRVVGGDLPLRLQVAFDAGPGRCAEAVFAASGQPPPSCRSLAGGDRLTCRD